MSKMLNSPVLFLVYAYFILLSSTPILSSPTFFAGIREKFSRKTHSKSSQPTTPNPASSSLAYLDKSFLPSIPPALENDNGPLDLTIIHTNDIHSHLSPFSKSWEDCTDDIKDCYGGIARIKTIIDNVREKFPNTYLFDAGDQFQGTMFFNYYKGEVSAKYMNKFGYDLMAVGNHEFDEGTETLAKFIDQAKFPVLSANLDATKDQYLRGKIIPFTVLTKYNTRIGIIGYITPDTASTGSAGPDVKFYDPVAPVQRMVDHLRSEGISKIICVSHNGYYQDMHLAAATSGIDAIVGGHSHTLLLNEGGPGVGGPYPTAVKNAKGRHTYIVQAKSFGEYVGIFQLQWDNKGNLKVGGRPIHVNDHISENQEISSLVKSWREPFDTLGNSVIGTSKYDLSLRGCSGGPCALGYLITTAMLRTHDGENSPIAVMNTRGIRNSLSRGDIKYSSVQSLLPAGTSIVCLEVTGSYILDMLNNIASRYNFQRKDYLDSSVQLGNIRFTANYRKSHPNKLLSIEVRSENGEWEPLRNDARYDLLTNDFVARGGDKILPSVFPKVQAGKYLADAVIDYIRSVEIVEISKEEMNWERQQYE
ncbi:Metallo-dependent phosphatase-like protein [Paraphysoderma sedebokerense]|nr:Metallo-dependent phosphatase-like protein [Paraphysoderma sedebokerense]